MASRALLTVRTGPAGRPAATYTDAMFTVAGRIRHQIDPVKGSRFIATVAPVESEEAARELLDEVSAEMSDASHHCTAWRIAQPAIDRCNDDGEPGGSAGRPILAQLTGRDLVNTAVVVTRYFGGTKLGVGGLVRAYGAAAAAALEHGSLEPYQPTVTATIIVDYGDVDRVIRAVEEHADITTPVYGETVTITLSFPQTDSQRLRAAVADATNGRTQMADPNPG